MNITLEWALANFRDANRYTVGDMKCMAEDHPIRLKAAEVFGSYLMGSATSHRYLTAVCSEIFRLVAEHFSKVDEMAQRLSGSFRE